MNETKRMGVKMMVTHATKKAIITKKVDFLKILLPKRK